MLQYTDGDECDEIERFNEILSAFKIKAICISHERVRNISLFDLKLYAGTRISTLQKFGEEIALALHSKSRLIFHPVLATGTVRVEVVNETQYRLNLMNELKTKPAPKLDLPLFLGNSIGGEDIWTDLTKNPHLLIAGTTGSGKTIMLHTIITNLLILSKARVYVVDTKGSEFSSYVGKFPNLSISDSYDQACLITDLLVKEMEFRYSMLSDDESLLSTFTPTVLIIDEFADLILRDKSNYLHNNLIALTQKSRAAGIHCVVATQHPSVDVIKGSIKANLPARIAFRVPTKTNSRVILDQGGAELLEGNGDAILSNYEHDFIRFQAAFTKPSDLLDQAA